jgi:hypothetical protein
LVDYIATTFEDEIGDGTVFTDEVKDVTSAPWTEGVGCWASSEMSNSLETNLALQVTYCVLAIIVYSVQQRANNLSDKACLALGAVGLLISIAMMIHVLLEPRLGDDGCPE